jgi:hypothetical protein
MTIYLRATYLILVEIVGLERYVLAAVGGSRLWTSGQSGDSVSANIQSPYQNFSGLGPPRLS